MSASPVSGTAGILTGIEKKNTDNSLWATTLNAHLQYHTELCKTWSVYLLLLLVLVWISLGLDTS
jgi:hypothetical protein